MKIAGITRTIVYLNYENIQLKILLLIKMKIMDIFTCTNLILIKFIKIQML